MNEQELFLEREELEREIREVFKGVTREGAVTWGESCIRNYECEIVLNELRLKHGRPPMFTDDQWADVLERTVWKEADRTEPYADTDTQWQDLIDDPLWRIGEWGGAFLYLDPVGRRYYLPAAMIRGLRDPDSIDLSYDLTLKHGDREDFLERWSALTDPEVQCVKRFVAFKAAWIEFEYEKMRNKGGNAKYFLPAYELMWEDEIWPLVYKSCWSEM